MRIPSLIVGLGNPGTKYASTPHNLGFEVVDELASFDGVKFQEKFQSLFGEVLLGGKKVFLMKPQTYMNLSGQAVQEASHFYKIPPEEIVALSDDLDLPFGQLRLRLSGGSGGHNGLQSLIDCLSSEAFARLRIGVGRPKDGGNTNFLLGKMSKAEKVALSESIKRAALALKESVTVGLEKVMNQVNLKKEAAP